MARPRRGASSSIRSSSSAGNWENLEISLTETGLPTPSRRMRSMTLPKASVGASRTPCFRRTDGTQTISRCPARGNHVRKPFQYRNASCTASTGEGQASCPGSPWSRTFRRPDLPGSKAGQADDSFPSCGPLGAGRRRSRERGRVGRRRAATARERCWVYGCFLHVTGIRARLHVNSRSPSGHAHTKPRSTARRRACPSNIGRHPRGSVGCPDETRLTGGAKYPPFWAVGPTLGGCQQSRTERADLARRFRRHAVNVRSCR